MGACVYLPLVVEVEITDVAEMTKPHTRELEMVDMENARIRHSRVDICCN